MDLKVYVLPISGGGFVTQLGLLSVLYDAQTIAKPNVSSSRDYSPDLVMASSGGNVATYIAMAGGWSSSGIRVSVPVLKSEMFVESWIPYLPSWLALPFTGSIFRRGFGSEDLFECLFTSTSIQKTEIWTGVFDQTHLRARLFCNRRASDSFIKSHLFDPFSDLYSAYPLRYLNGNLSKIARISYASAAIPFVTESQTFEGNSFTDGGTMFASPLSLLDKSLRPIIVEGNRRLRLFYICSYNMESYFPEINGYTRSVGALIHSQIIQDRSNAIGILDSLASDNEIIHLETHSNLNTTTFAAILTELEMEKHYVVILYPRKEKSVNITCFTAEDVMENLELATDGFGIHVWTLRLSPGE